MHFTHFKSYTTEMKELDLQQKILKTTFRVAQV